MPPIAATAAAVPPAAALQRPGKGEVARPGFSGRRLPWKTGRRGPGSRKPLGAAAANGHARAGKDSGPRAWSARRSPSAASAQSSRPHRSRGGCAPPQPAFVQARAQTGPRGQKHRRRHGKREKRARKKAAKAHTADQLRSAPRRGRPARRGDGEAQGIHRRRPHRAS